jgi:tetratricopeptide (TPR) repeat protein
MNQHTPKHFFISYNKADRTWAEWIAWHLEEAGFTTIIQAWDFRPGMNFVQKMQEAVQQAERTIAVLSTNYLEALYTYPEWQTAYQQDPRGEKAVLVPVRIQECKPPGLLGLISYIDLVGLDETAAHETLLDGVRQGRNKPPTAPLFPGTMNEAQRTVSQQPSFPGAFPPIWNVPYARNPYFTGREMVFEHLHEALSSDSATAITQGHAIFGLGGIGKTQTAVEYTYRYHSEYRFIFWVRAETEVVLQAGFVEIARLLDMPDKDATNPAETVQAVKHWLVGNGEWLLVFDNADAPELLKAYYPRTPRGHILLTSRAHLFDMLGIARPLALEKLDPDEALDFLFKRTERAQSDPAEKKAAEYLATELGYLPLALEQAGAYIIAKTARFQDYLASYQRQRLSLLNKAQPSAGEYPASIATTWALNFQEVEQDPAAADILRVSAFLSPDAIPLELLIQGASELGPVIALALATSEDPLVLNEALEPLTRYSLIRLDVDTQTYSIHRMVQEVLKDQMGLKQQAFWAERVVRAVAQSFPEVDYHTWSRCERLIPHALLCAAHIDNWDMIFPEARKILYQTGKYFYQRGQYWEAEPFGKKYLAICERVLGPEHPDTLGSLSILAILYVGQGKYEQAEPFSQRALEASERILGPEHPSTLDSLNNLAELYREQGKFEQAEPLYQRALTTSERVLGPEHPDTLRPLSNLALLYTVQDKYEQAEPLYQRVLTTREQMLGPEHPDTLSSLNNLAILYRNQGKYEQAEPLYQRALTTRERVLGPEHPDTLGSVNNLANLYMNQDKYEQAEPLYQRALKASEQVLKPEHPITLSIVSNLAVIYANQGKYEQAESLFQRALAIFEQVLGADHPDTARALSNLAELYRNQGKYEQAEPLYQRALAIREQVFGTDHPKTEKVREDYANLLKKMKQKTK